MSAIVALATQGGPRLIAVAIAFVGGLKFIKWAVEFGCTRLDARAEAVLARELAVEKRFNQRLKHVELELELYREVSMKLVNAFAEFDPTNPVLSDVAKILRRAAPIVPPDASLDNLMNRAGAALDGGGKA